MTNTTKHQIALLLGVVLLALFFPRNTFAISPAAQQALEKMHVAEDFTVSLVASEPEIRQPISVTFDERGRMWVIQYLQYPKPAGLTPVKVDVYLRTKYDRVPEPPPRGPKGADRITICEDTDGDGRADTFKDFLSGLNLCSGMALGHGGVFVAQPPYLLFYPDRNQDDIPDGDPEVLLSGFGIEDAHALVNSLTWGPDGWLYGAQGSTVTANIRGLQFQQGIWRYHPITREFELFAEGGGNTWGVDFDSNGELIVGTNFDDKMLHQVQGAYYLKNFGKHGELQNPHAYGFFGHVPYTGYRGPHLSVGGIVYQGGAFPESFRNTYISANTLDHAIYWHKLKPKGSSFTGSFGGPLLKTSDELFRPVDCQTGPDGALYITDWTDKRATHVDPLDTWDRSNGRIYRIQSKAALAGKKFDLAKLSSNELVDLLTNQNDWFAREARRLLADRRDQTVFGRLRKQISSNNPHLALQSLWALTASGGFNESLAMELLAHPNENVRAWSIRLAGDTRKVSPSLQQALTKIAKSDASPIVRRQLACTAKRLSGNDALPVIRELLLHNEDVDDQFVPLLLWWAIEDKAISNREAIAKIFASPSVQQSAMAQKHILERLARRYTAAGSDADFAVSARLLEAAPGPTQTEALLNGMELGMVGRKQEQMPAPLTKWLNAAWAKPVLSTSLLRTGLRLGDPRARSAAFALVNDANVGETNRAELLEIIGQTGNPDCVPQLLTLFKNSSSGKVRRAALSALQHFPNAEVSTALLGNYASLSLDLRGQVRAVLASRPAWARALVDAVEQKRIAATEISPDEARQLAKLKDAELTKRVEKLWGKIRTDSPEEKKNFIHHARLVLKPSGAAGRDAKGNPAEGRKLFIQACGVCHTLFGEGGKVGPDLTTADRKSTDVLLQNIVNPSAYVRPEFVNFEVETKDDRSIGGLMVESTPTAVTILDRNNQRHVIARDQIASLRELDLSLMPEGLLEALQPQQLMDLFAYLQSNGPPRAAK